MEKLEIKDVSSEKIDDLINLCIPMERSSEPQFIEGAKAKKWATETFCKKRVCFSFALFASLRALKLLRADSSLQAPLSH